MQNSEYRGRGTGPAQGVGVDERPGSQRDDRGEPTPCTRDIDIG